MNQILLLLLPFIAVLLRRQIKRGYSALADRVQTDRRTGQLARMFIVLATLIWVMLWNVSFIPIGHHQTISIFAAKPYAAFVWLAIAAILLGLILIWIRIRNVVNAGICCYFVGFLVFAYSCYKSANVNAGLTLSAGLILIFIPSIIVGVMCALVDKTRFKINKPPTVITN